MTRLRMPLYKLLELKSKGQIKEHYSPSRTQWPARHAYGYDEILLLLPITVFKYIPVSPGWNQQHFKIDYVRV